MIDYKVEHICSYAVHGTAAVPPEVIGPVPEGIRVNFYSTGGGELTGPKVRGKVRPVGGDWMTVRNDGIGILDARVTLETDDAALILVTYGGVIDFGQGGYDMFRRGELPAEVRARTSPRFFTSHPEYLCVNTLSWFGVRGDLAAYITIVHD